MEPIGFTDPGTGETDFFYVIEKTELAEAEYLLVSEEEDEDADVYILKCISQDEGDCVIYEMIEDRQELEAVAKLFSELPDDTIIE